MSLEELRKKIDETDDKIARLIAERIRISEEIGKEKKRQGRRIVDTERERKVLENVRRIARDEKISQEDIESIYQQIMIASKKVQG
jgi:chorismate mutase